MQFAAITRRISEMKPVDVTDGDRFRLLSKYRLAVDMDIHGYIHGYIPGAVCKEKREG